MRVTARAALAAYLTVIAASLPVMPSLVTAVSRRFGFGMISLPLHLVLATLLLAPALRLFRRSGAPLLPAIPAYLGLLAAGVLTALFIAPSPVSRIHLAEYALLAVLVIRSLPVRAQAGRLFLGFALAAFIGLGDETVQFFLPNRVFDWYDVILNVAAAALGTAGEAWWRWTGGGRGW